MKTNMLTRVRAMWPDSRYNQRAWVKSIRLLGDKWLLAAAPTAQELASPINRKAT